jgi:hypothetical protein
VLIGGIALRDDDLAGKSVSKKVPGGARSDDAAADDDDVCCVWNA